MAIGSRDKHHLSQEKNTVPLRIRLTILLACLVAIFAAGTVMVRMSDRSPVTLLQEDSKLRSAHLLRRVMEYRGESLRSHVSDYSLWDEMVAAAERRDTAWCRQYIETGVRIFGNSYAWLCDTKLGVVYSAKPDSFSHEIPLPLPVGEWRAAFRSGSFPYYFHRIEGQIAEVAIAPVQPVRDTARTSPPRGYYIVARLWDERVLDDISITADATIDLADLEVNSAGWKSEPHYGIIRFSDTLTNWQGQPLALVRAETFSRSLLDLHVSATSRLWILVGLALLLFAVWIYYVRRWVMIPLADLSTALEHESSEPAARLREMRDEFGQAARLMDRYFQQRIVLQKEVSDRTRTEEVLRLTIQELQDTSRQLSMVLNNARVFLYSHDPYGNFTFVSPSVEKVTGYAPNEFGKHYALMLTDHPMNAQVVRNTEYALQTGKDVPPYRAEIYHKDRRKLILEISERPNVVDGEVTGVIGVARDVTEFTENEKEREVLTQQLQRAERMETLAMMAGGVAHDLNNTLGPLVAYPEMILGTMAADAEFRPEIEEIQRSATQAAAIVKDLLSMARRGRYQMTPVDLNAIVRGYFETPGYKEMRRKYTSIEVLSDLCESPAVVLGSVCHLQNVLMNIVVNAFEAMGDTGQLRISTCTRRKGSLTHDDQQRDSGVAILTISDNGPGIPPEFLSRVFEPYFSTKKMGKSGSGLGLAVVNGIVADHSGRLDVQSRVGEGTTFEITLPLTDKQPGSGIALPEDVTGNETVLVLDDVAEQRRVASKVLEGFGYSVCEAGTLNAALQEIQTRRINVAVVDMLLNDAYDGLDAIRRIREIAPTSRIVVVSGYAFTQRVQDILDSGNAVFLAKPYTGKELGRMVRTVLDQETVPARSVVQV